MRLSKAAITVAEPDQFNRWLMPLSSALVHTSIGSVYSYSMWNVPLTLQLGVVAPAAGDWALGDSLGVYSATAVALGVTMARRLPLISAIERGRTRGR